MLLIRQNLILSFVQNIVALRIAYLYRKQREKYQRLFDLTIYLVNIIEQNQLPLDEFDVIALQNLGVEITIREEY